MIEQQDSFALGYNSDENSWHIIESPESSLSYDDFTTNPDNVHSWIIRLNWSTSDWRIYTRRTRYVFGSVDDIRFYNQNGKRKFNTESNKPDRDRITISKINVLPSGSNMNVGKDIDVYTQRYYAESDGYTDNHKVIVTLADIDNDNYPDDPVIIKEFINEDEIRLKKVLDNGFSVTLLNSDGDITRNGRENLYFVWRRIAESQYRNDPSISNIHDIFVLTQSYDNQYRRWLSNDRNILNKPDIVSEIDLESQFSSIDNKKVASDSVIYRSSEYRILFGDLAEEELRGRFKVVKVIGTTLTDNEIKTRILSNINEFFNIDNWDFGETFYFTELSAYIHQNLPGIVSSIVIQPLNADSVFGQLFQITPESNQLFIPDITLKNIDIVETLSEFTGDVN